MASHFQSTISKNFHVGICQAVKHNYFLFDVHQRLFSKVKSSQQIDTFASIYRANGIRTRGSSLVLFTRDDGGVSKPHCSGVVVLVKMFVGCIGEGVKGYG